MDGTPCFLQQPYDAPSCTDDTAAIQDKDWQFLFEKLPLNLR